MTTFEMPKEVDAIQEATLLEADWHMVRLTQEPTLEDNAKKKAGNSEEDGAGQNIVLRFRVVDDDPTINGRQLTKWLGWPNEGDKERFTNKGQPMIDAKMETIVTWATVLGGTVEGSNISINSGSECHVLVTQEEYKGELQNSIDMNAAPKPL